VKLDAGHFLNVLERIHRRRKVVGHDELEGHVVEILLEHEPVRGQAGVRSRHDDLPETDGMPARILLPASPTP
jgi:hypothetical protein